MFLMRAILLLKTQVKVMFCACFLYARKGVQYLVLAPVISIDLLSTVFFYDYIENIEPIAPTALHQGHSVNEIFKQHNTLAHLLTPYLNTDKAFNANNAINDVQKWPHVQ